MSNDKKLVLICYKNGITGSFSACSPRKALVMAMSRLGLRSLTRRNFDKVHGAWIRFDGRIIFPVKHKRTLDKRKDKHANRRKPPVAKIEHLDVGRRRHDTPRQRRVA